MKLASFRVAGRNTIGIVKDEIVIDLATLGLGAPRTMLEVLHLGRPFLQTLSRSNLSGGTSYLVADIELRAPVPDPSKYLAIGLNYRDHAEEARKAGVMIPDTQVWFNKQVSCITGPHDGIVLPRVSEKLDYEVELAVVIGRSCRRVSAADAHSVIAGYMVANDVTVRDWQHRSPTWTLGKSFDTHGPTGPWLTTADEIPDPHDLLMKLWVSGELRQEASTGGMIYDIYQQIEHLSTVMTLQAGDILATGTPSGVGAALKPQRWLSAGDIVRVEIERLGYIENRVVADTP